MRRAKRGRRRVPHWREAATSLGVLVAILVGAQVLPAFGVESYILPTPSQVLSAFVNDLGDATFWSNAWATGVEVVLGCLLGSLLGFLLGIVVTSSSFINAVVTPYMVVLQAVPKVAIAPIIVVGLGYGLTSKVVIAATISFFPLFVNVEAGLRSVDPDQLELMRALRAGRWQTLRWVQLPSALPTIFGGLEMAFVFSVVGAVVGEFAGASRGLGYVINARSFQLDQAGVFSALIVLSAMALALDVVVRSVGHRLSRWQRVGVDTGPAATPASGGETQSPPAVVTT
jgi:NitT/TauT family transport system permease protein